MLAPVATGVVKLEGSSDEKMVALDGEMRYLAFKVASNDSLNPAHASQCHPADNLKLYLPLTLLPLPTTIKESQRSLRLLTSETERTDR